MAFDRNKFKGGSREAQKAVQKSEPKNTGSKRQSWHYVEEGRNEFRLAPPHNPLHSSYELYRTANIDCDVPVWENGEKTEKTEVKNRKIISATVHSESLKKLGVDGDPLELYVKLVKDHAFSEIKDKDKRNKYLAPINGYRGAQGKWVWGITAKNSFLAYAWSKDGELGKVELYSAWVRDMDKLAAELEVEGDVIEVDPFSNIDEGYPLIINKDKVDGKWVYTIGKGEPSRAKKETYDEFFERTALTDGQLTGLSKLPSLNSSYVNSYQLRDFELALNGLKMFDEKNNFGIFNDDSFLDKLEAIQVILEEEEKVRKDNEENDKEESEKVVETVENKESTVEVTTNKAPVRKRNIAPKVDKRKFVEEFIAEAYGSDYVDQIPTGVDLDKWYDMAKADEDLPLEPLSEEVDTPVEVVEEVAEIEVKSEEVKPTDLSNQIANLRKRSKK